jgi:hypothetical protein
MCHGIRLAVATYVIYLQALTARFTSPTALRRKPSAQALMVNVTKLRDLHWCDTGKRGACQCPTTKSSLEGRFAL